MIRYLAGQQICGIASEQLEAQFSPVLGGRMIKFTHKQHANIIIPMESHRFPVTNWPRAGGYPLVPYHNRLSEASITVNEIAYALPAHPAARPHTLHGPGHTRSWHVDFNDETRLVMVLNYEANEDWPWAFEATQDFQVEGDVLSLSMSIANRDCRPMPAALGWHPYFSSQEDVVTDAGFCWPHQDNYLPTGERIAITDPVVQRQRATSYLERWSEARITCTDGPVVTMRASAPFDFLVVHRGDDSHVCVEPVTHVANAWNLDCQGVGARTLLPGGSLHGTVAIKVCG